MDASFLTPLLERGTAFPGVAARRRRFAFSFILFAQIIPIVLASGLSAFGATSADKPRASAAGISGTSAELNGVRMTPGATLFSGDVVKLGAASSVALQFGKSLLLAAPQTELVIGSDGVSLRGGHVQIRASGAGAFLVSGPFFLVNIIPSGGAPGSVEIQVGGMSAQISALAGVADITAPGNTTPYELHAGETATLDAAGGDAAQGQGAANPAAGQVSRLLPDVQIERSSKQMVAAASAPVFWNDDLRSGPTGRAHITLTDGSLLNLGSNSSLRILQHDAQAQQTSLDLTVGRMRGRVLKLTRPGAKFEIRTPVGAAGLVGTDFSLLVTPDNTELIVFEGVVRFTASNGQAATVPARMKLRISRTGAFQGPSPATPQEIQIAKDLTDISETPVQNAADRKNRRLVPIVISSSAGAVVLAVGLYLSTHVSVSPIVP